MSTQRADEPLPGGRLSVRHYCAVHHHLFQDVYAWAGKFRRMKIARDGSMFCYPENIAGEMHALFAELREEGSLRGLARHEFASRAAHSLTTLNAIHPFRDGNGRAQLMFMALLAAQAGHTLDLTALDPPAFLNATFPGSSNSLRCSSLQAQSGSYPCSWTCNTFV